MPGLERHERTEPHYALCDLKRCFASGDYWVPNRVRRHLDRRRWSDSFFLECIARLLPADFYKSQMHMTRDDVWLDVYRPMFEDRRVYVKVTEAQLGHGFILLSFCLDGESH